MISAKDIEILLSIARAGSDYDAIKRLLNETSWKIEEDEIDLGYLRISVRAANGESCRLIIGYRDPEHPPYFLLTFVVLPEFDEHLPAFNSIFHLAAETLTKCLGSPTVSGEHKLPFRNWPYAYCRWSLAEGEFTLVQDEFDIQDGMDVTLWMHPVGTPLEEIVHQ